MILFRTVIVFCFALWAGTMAAAAETLTVEVSIVGLEDDLAREMKRVSSLARQPQRYGALRPIRRAADSDAAAIRAALHSKGFYAADVSREVIRAADLVAVTFRVDPGAPFVITSYELRYADDQDAPRPASLEALGIKADGDPSGADLKRIEGELLEALWNDGYLGAALSRQEVQADFGAATAHAVFEFETGAQGTYGNIVVQGLDRTLPDYVRQFRPFERGEIAQRSDLATYRERLVETSLFNEIEVLPQLPQADGTTDVLVRLAERKHRTLGGGLAFATDIGPSATGFWENRNFLRRGETLRAEINASGPVQEGILSFQKNRPRLPGRYTFATALKNEDTAAFNAQTVRVGASLAKLWADRRLTTEAGVSLQYSDITEQQCLDSLSRTLTVTEDMTCAALGGTVRGEQDTFQAVGFPLSVVWNSETDPLDPQEGFKAQFLVAPYFGTHDFQRIEIGYTDRVFWGAEDGGTLAGRFRLGAIYGTPREFIPATERYYAGGGGSIRGYAFQEASPIDEQTGEILGGASLAEFNIELRQHLTDTLEVAIFTDVGGSFEDNSPTFDQVLVGAGLGVRYHTAIGPVRLDFAVPLDRRSFVVPDTGGPEFGGDENDDPDTVFEDTSFQFYIGLGQPF